MLSPNLTLPKQENFSLGQHSRFLYNINKTGVLYRTILRSIYIYPFHLLPSSFFSLSLLVVAQIRGHIQQALLPPSPLRFVPSILSREDFSSFFPRRLASNCAYPRQALSAVVPSFFAKKVKISPRRGSNSRTNNIDSSIRRLPLDHRGDRLDIESLLGHNSTKKGSECSARN